MSPLSSSEMYVVVSSLERSQHNGKSRPEGCDAR